MIYQLNARPLAILALVGCHMRMRRRANYWIWRGPSAPQSPYVEGGLDGLVQFLEFAGVARPHQPLQAVTRNGEYVVEIRNTRDG